MSKELWNQLILLTSPNKLSDEALLGIAFSNKELEDDVFQTLIRKQSVGLVDLLESGARPDRWLETLYKEVPIVLRMLLSGSSESGLPHDTRCQIGNYMLQQYTKRSSNSSSNYRHAMLLPEEEKNFWCLAATLPTTKLGNRAAWLIAQCSWNAEALVHMIELFERDRRLVERSIHKVAHANSATTRHLVTVFGHSVSNEEIQQHVLTRILSSSVLEETLKELMELSSNQAHTQQITSRAQDLGVILETQVDLDDSADEVNQLIRQLIKGSSPPPPI